MNNNSGFSLIELTVVILIVSLLIGGVATSSLLSSQAELRTVIADLQNYRSMYQAFVQQYKQVPGDMSNAATIWPTAGLCSVSVTCNGNGNGVVDAVFNSANDETARAWKHLQLAGIFGYQIVPIPTGYVGVMTLGDMSPRSKVEGAGYYIAAGADIGGDAVGTIIPSPWTDNRTNAVFLGKKSSSASSNGFTMGSLNATSSYNIDKKIDDGITDSSGDEIGFNSGKVRTIQDQTGGTNCINGSTYNMSVNSPATCILGYQLHEIN